MRETHRTEFEFELPALVIWVVELEHRKVVASCFTSFFALFVVFFQKAMYIQLTWGAA